MKAHRRLPWAPLYDHVAGRYPYPPDLHDLAHACGVTTRTVRRWRREDFIPEPAADRAATHLGLHPAHIWGDIWWNLAREVPA